MHLLWEGAPVPAPVAALADLITHWNGWESIQPRAAAAAAAPDGLLLDWSPRPPAGSHALPLLWIARTDPGIWKADAAPEKPDHLRPAKDVQPLDLALAQPVDDDGPYVPLMRGAEPVPLPRGIVLARAPSGAPVVVGLQGRDGASPAIYVGSDVASLILQSLGAERDRALATAGHPVAGLFVRTLAPEHMVKFPWINHALEAIRWCCAWVAREAGVPRVSVGRYPEGKSWALALSHDVDVCRRTTTHVLKQVRHAGRRAGLALAAGSPRRAGQAIAAGVRTGARRDFWAVEQCLAADEALGVRSAFYFYSRVNTVSDAVASIYDPDYSLTDPRVGRSIAGVVDRGCEVGLHGSYRSHGCAELLGQERDALERCLGQPVAGVRQHFLQGEAPDVWRTQEAAGLVYDTSWGYRDRTGFRSGAAFPHRLWDGEEERGLDVWQLPLVLMDGQLFDRECATDDEVPATMDSVLDQLRMSGGAGAADWHQRFFADVSHPWRLTYERMVQRARDAGAWLGPCGALVEWWRVRRGFRWSVTKDAGAWTWRLESAEPLAKMTIRLTGVDAASVEVAGDGASDVSSAGTDVLLTVGELGPGQPLEFRATARA